MKGLAAAAKAGSIPFFVCVAVELRFDAEPVRCPPAAARAVASTRITIVPHLVFADIIASLRISRMGMRLGTPDTCPPHTVATLTVLRGEAREDELWSEGATPHQEEGAPP